MDYATLLIWDRKAGSVHGICLLHMQEGNLFYFLRSKHEGMAALSFFSAFTRSSPICYIYPPIIRIVLAMSQASLFPFRHLVRPSPQVPWDVSILNSIPSGLQDGVVSKSKVAAYDSYEDVHAMLSMDDGKISLFRQRSVYEILYHPLLNGSNSLLLSVSGNDDSYFVYALNSISGFLALWWLPRTTTTPSMVPRAPSCKLRLASNSLSGDNCLSSVHLMKAFGNNLFMTSKSGRVWRCSVSSRPMVLTATELIRTYSSVWDRVFRTVTVQRNPSPILAFLPISSTATERKEIISGNAIAPTSSPVFSMTQAGDLELWKEEEGEVVCRLHDLLENTLEDSFDGVEVCHASSSINDVIDVIVKLQRPRRSRIYYLRISSDARLIQCTWLNRFPDSVNCFGLVSCDNGMAYAVFETSPTTVIAMGGGNLETTVHEVDLPFEEVSALVGIAKDFETHGVSLLTTSGYVLRARYIQLQATVASVSDEQSYVIARHLRAAFWKYYQTRTLQMPPSITSIISSFSNQVHTTNKIGIAEAAIIITARQLQKEADGSSSHNPMEWHLAFMQLLKQAGLLKNISSSGRWMLLGIGQEIAIHSILAKSDLFVKDLPPFGLAVKITQVQHHILSHAPTMEWSVVLQQVLQAAMKYREEHAVISYDVLTDPKNLWMHEIHECLLLQLKHPEIAKIETLETIAVAALQVHQELKSKNYALVKSLAIHIVRSQLKNDDLARKLSLEHAYYEGLCQLSIDKPSEFSLEPILTKWSDFGSFSLRWFTQQGHYDKALTYGRLLPEDFKKIVDEDLIRFKWIYELRQKNFSGTTEALFSNATGHNLDDTEWHLSMAKLAGKISSMSGGKRGGKNETSSDKLLRLIENKLDLVKAQRLLIDDDTVPLQTSEYLLKLAINKCDSEIENIVHNCMIGLIIASADENMDGIATFWSKAISVDMDRWEAWIKASPSPTRDFLVEQTAFGKLWQEVQEQPVDLHPIMQYDIQLEDKVVRNMPSLDRGAARELKRLLQDVITIPISSKSLIAGNMDEMDFS
jgi:hypothetical protein